MAKNKVLMNYIRSNYFGKIGILKLHQLESIVLPRIVSDEKAVRKYYLNATGKELNLESPTTFTEKLNWYKLKVRDPLMTQCADKYAVRQYVADSGCMDILNELYGVYDSVDEIDLKQLPDQFIIKAAHGSHMNLVVKNKNSFDFKKQRRILKLWLKQDIYWSGREWAYKEVPKRLVAERFLGDNLTDYKFYCFNGVPEFVDVDIDRYSNHVRNYYDMEWNLLSLKCSFVPNNPSIKIMAPSQFERMKEIATILSAPFQFVRVDLYEVDRKVFFGELTFYQDGGFPGYTEEWDKKVGDMWNNTVGA